MSSPFLGEIRAFAFNFPPLGWALCNGQILPIQQYAALFAIVGTTYGGDGKSTFGLPNLQGMAPMPSGQGPGLSLHDLGETGGVENVTLLATQVPAHNHTYNAGAGGRGEVATVTGNVNAAAAALTNIYGASSDGTQMSGGMIVPTAASQPHENRQPFQVLNFCIAMSGIFPSRG